MRSFSPSLFVHVPRLDEADLSALGHERVSPGALELDAAWSNLASFLGTWSRSDDARSAEIVALVLPAIASDAAFVALDAETSWPKGPIRLRTLDRESLHVSALDGLPFAKRVPNEEEDERELLSATLLAEIEAEQVRLVEEELEEKRKKTRGDRSTWKTRRQRRREASEREVASA